MKSTIAFLVLLAALSGCQGSVVGDAIAGPEVLAKQDNDYCVSLGAQPGSDIYVQCRMQMATNRDNRHASARARASQNFANMNANMNANRMRTTNCNRFGNSINCTTY